MSKAFQVACRGSGCAPLAKRALPGRRGFTTDSLLAVACGVLDVLLLPFGVSEALWRRPQSLSS